MAFELIQISACFLDQDDCNRVSKFQLFRVVFWDILPCKIRDSSLMMEAVRTSETSVDNNFTRQYIPEYNSEHHTRRRENLKSHKFQLATIALRLLASGLSLYNRNSTRTLTGHYMVRGT
jgi:hypothetical protein